MTKEKYPCTNCGAETQSHYTIGGVTKPYCNPCFFKLRPPKESTASKYAASIKNTRKNMQSTMRKREEERVAEENWGGHCKGGCGKVISGEYVCYDCRKKAAEKNFALQPGEVDE
jgi:DNA-directed RNA polymerase subunit RPC12/RpoP